MDFCKQLGEQHKLEPDPMYVYSRISPTEASDAYSQVSAPRIVAQALPIKLV